MSEPWGDAGAAAAAQPPAAADGLTAGALLRRAREAAGLHVAALAVSLKVPVRKLEALEDDRWDLLPDAVFVRALASSVCRTLKIDPQPVLERLPQTTTPRLVQVGDGINTPFRAPSDGAPPRWIDQLTRPVFLAVFALLLGALVLILLPTVQQGTGGTTATPADAPPLLPAVVVPPREEQVAVAPAPATPAPRTAASVPSVSAPAASSAATASPAPAAASAVIAKAASVPLSAVKPASAPAAAASAKPSVPPAASATAALAPAPAASGIVVFRTRGPSWIEVTDAKGTVAVRKVLEAGETAGASGALPLQVTIGRVDHTDVQVRGKPFDLRPVSKDNVARFEVK